MWNVKFFKEAAVLFSTSQINHSLILANITRNSLLLAEFSVEMEGGEKRKKQGRKKIQLFHLKSRTIYAAVPVYQH